MATFTLLPTVAQLPRTWWVMASCRSALSLTPLASLLTGGLRWAASWRSLLLIGLFFTTQQIECQGFACTATQWLLPPGGTDAQVDVSTLAAGLYTVRVQAGGQIAAQQVVAN